MKFPSRQSPKSTAAQRPKRRRLLYFKAIGLFMLSCLVSLWLGLFANTVQAQSVDIQQEENQLIREFALPAPASNTPVYRPRPAAAPPPRRSPTSTAPASGSPAPANPPAAAANDPEPEPAAAEESSPNQTYQYVLDFNRSPVVGNGFHLQGPYASGRLGFSRPKSWNLQSAKALIRFQHSPALLASRSNLTVRVNGTSLSSVPLNRRQSEIGGVLFNIPPNLFQDFNEIAVIAQQSDTDQCPKAGDPTLWTDILPDSKLIFEFEPQAVALDFSSYPYPLFDELSLDSNRITYVLPTQTSDTWLSAAARLQASLGQFADFRGVNTNLVSSVDNVSADQKLVVIGTPNEQPALADLSLPLNLAGNQVLDGNQVPLPPDVGILMLTTTEDTGTLVLVATGNGPEGVAKAVQLLVQPEDRKLATGQYMLVNSLTNVPTPDARNWPRFLPQDNSFKLSDLQTANAEPFADATVRGAGAPPIEFDFRALPDDEFRRGSSMNLRYSYGPQINPRTSAVEVLLDGVAIGGERLSSENGAENRSLKVDLPANLITPTSQIQVYFRLNPREPAQCGQVTDQQLWGTVHADTSFNLKRGSSVQLPDLNLLLVGYPFVAPQDLSNTAIVVPDSPTSTDVALALEVSERLGRMSQAESIKLDVYTTGTLPSNVRNEKHLIGIGERSQFPFPEAFQASNGLGLREFFSRQRGGSQIQAPDQDGVIKETMSPWNGERVLLALSAQTDAGLDRVQGLFSQDSWFFRLRGDTVLVNASNESPASPDATAYNLEFLQQANQRRLDSTGPLVRASRMLQENWFLLPTGIVMFALVFYGVAELYLKRNADRQK